MPDVRSGSKTDIRQRDWNVRQGQKRLMQRSKMDSIALFETTAVSGDFLANYVLTGRA
jgi:hypothetical protein